MGAQKEKKSLLKNNLVILTIILIVMCIVLTIATDYFATAANLVAILNQVISNGTLAVGMTFVLLTGGIDLSVGSMVSLCGVCLASMINLLGLPLAPAILLTLNRNCNWEYQWITGIFGKSTCIYCYIRSSECCSWPCFDNFGW